MFTPKLRNYSNSTIKYKVYKKLDHISGLLQIVKRFIHPLKALLFLSVKSSDIRLSLLSIDYLHKTSIKVSPNNNFISTSLL